MEYFSSEMQQCNQIPICHRKMVSLVQKRHVGCVHRDPHISRRDPARVFALLSLSLQAARGPSTFWRASPTDAQPDSPFKCIWWATQRYTPCLVTNDITMAQLRGSPERYYFLHFCSCQGTKLKATQRQKCVGSP